MTSKEAAAYLRYSHSQICALCQSGELTHTRSRPGASYRFRVEWLDAFLDGRTRGLKPPVRPVIKAPKIDGMTPSERRAAQMKRLRELVKKEERRKREQ